MVKGEAENRADQLKSDLQSRVLALRWMADRWEQRGGTPNDEFVADARAYIADMGGFQSISWVDKEYIVRWIIPLEGNEQALFLNLTFEKNRRNALEKAKALKSPTMTSSIDLVQGGKGFLVYVPLYIRDEFQGFVLGVFRIQDWMDLVFNAKEYRESEDFRIAAIFDEIPVYKQEGWEALKGIGLGSVGQVQSSLMTAVFPEADGFDFAFRAKPSRYLNGDFYDCQVVDGTHCSIMLADIAGKGLPAALFASSARALYRLALNETCSVLPIEESTEPGAILRLLNGQMLRALEIAESFLAMIAVRINLGNGLLEIANAGGCKVIVFEGSARASRVLETGGLPIGLFPDPGIETETVGLRPGMGALIYSDGLTEAANKDDELFGLSRLLEVTARHSRDKAEDMATWILASIEDFQAGLPFSDDATFIVIKAKPRNFSFDFVSSLDSLDEMPRRIAYLCSSYGEALAHDMELAASEILANIREHGYGSADGPVSMELRLEMRGVELLIKERGKAFDPDTVPAPSGGGERGFGIFLIREVMDDFSYESGGADGNLWILFRSAKAHGG
jgi:serine phosphatase RsbU (regulator of sigma subunit)/anti-sigma regulatory factor (Ser/Thr protein kinase)